MHAFVYAVARNLVEHSIDQIAHIKNDIHHFLLQVSGGLDFPTV